ncbi:3-hydroxyacyl-CoA dehydrogenase family protein [Nocardioides marmoriginsengisoli]|uniref:3-hydroxyacyl-CoA dehydrogenase family protein n=1 Tax=Nocardioides marmoriginsengisoli TaxID=661483 RepID=A0A3N0CIP4_9ACTN|nr:3-hydroxyacyl-CoA dehydrogenase family protein [Nocardioides marmoriginsengisoli]RNL62813.1 3-hydroxyacyl-CoA dehydrogenase family protein [Nocardioides marmoriginsengisoli]
MPYFEKIVVVGTDALADGIAAAAEAAGCSVVRVADASDPGGAEDALRAAYLVVEAVAEDATAKHDALRAIASLAARTAVIATTTATLSVTELATAVPGPERVAGLHFLHRTLDGAAVEVVRTDLVAPGVLERLSAFVDELGKVAVEVKDRPGFLLNRLLMPYLNDVVQALDDGLASAEDLDVALRLGLGYRRGPLEMLDDIGLDAHEQATDAAFAALQDRVFAAPPLLRTMVATGRTGGASGSGFHDRKDHA